MVALRFKTCRLLPGNVRNRELTIIQRHILRKLRNKKRFFKKKIYPKKNLNSYIQSQTTRKLPLFHGNLPITKMHRGTERTSYIPFLLNPETRLDVIPVRLHFFLFVVARKIVKVYFFIQLLALVNVVPCCSFLPVPDLNFPLNQDGLSIDLNERPSPFELLAELESSDSFRARNSHLENDLDHLKDSLENLDKEEDPNLRQELIANVERQVEGLERLIENNKTKDALLSQQRAEYRKVLLEEVEKIRESQARLTLSNSCLRVVIQQANERRPR